MTACPDWRDSLLDSALGIPVSRDLAEHLKTCAACAEALSGLCARREQMDTGLRQLVQSAEPRPGFSARLMASVEAPRARRARWMTSPSVWAAVLAVVVLAGVLTVPVRKWMARDGSAEAPVSSAALSEWRSPTETLLRSPGDELLRSSPRLGEFYFPVQAARPPAGGDPTKWRNP